MILSLIHWFLIINILITTLVLPLKSNVDLGLVSRFGEFWRISSLIFARLLSIFFEVCVFPICTLNIQAEFPSCSLEFPSYQWVILKMNN